MAASSFQANQLYTACRLNDVIYVQELLVALKDNQEMLDAMLTFRDGEQRTPLLIATRQRNFNLVQMLVTVQSEQDVVKAVTTTKDTPLHLACTMSAEGVSFVELLLHFGADTEARNQRQCTPLHLAAAGGAPKLVECLLLKSAEPDVQDREGQTPLFLAAQKGHLEVATLLLARGAKINLAQGFKCTPLYIAAKEGRTAMVLLLLAAGADHKLASDKGLTPLHSAAKNGHLETARVLLAAGASPRVSPNFFSMLTGGTPVHEARSSGHDAIASLLDRPPVPESIRSFQSETRRVGALLEETARDLEIRRKNAEAVVSLRKHVRKIPNQIDRKTFKQMLRWLDFYEIPHYIQWQMVSSRNGLEPRYLDNATPDLLMQGGASTFAAHALCQDLMCFAEVRRKNGIHVPPLLDPTALAADFDLALTTHLDEASRRKLLEAGLTARTSWHLHDAVLQSTGVSSFAAVSICKALSEMWEKHAPSLQPAPVGGASPRRVIGPALASSSSPLAASSSSSSTSASAALNGCGVIELWEIDALEMFSEGKYGEVYRGMYQGRRVCLKKLKQRFQDSPDMDHFFLQGLSVWRQLAHENIVQLLGANMDPMMAVMTMMVGSLRSHLNREKTVFPSVLIWARDTARGLAYMHGLTPPIVHRDLKAANVLLSYDLNNAKLADFDCARPLNEHGILDATPSQSQLGTPGFMAPEIFLEPQRQTAAIDVYALGMTLYEMLRPEIRDVFSLMEAPRDIDLIQFITDKFRNGYQPPNPRTPISTVPGDLQKEESMWDLIHRCLLPSPTERPNAAEVSMILDMMALAPPPSKDFNYLPTMMQIKQQSGTSFIQR